MRALNACAAGVAVLVAIAFPGGALGKSLPPGVHVDPGSPAGKEYQIPVASARGLAAGPKGSNSGANPPLFGVGVTSARSPSATTAGGGSGTTRASGSGTTTGSGSGTTAGRGSRTNASSALRRSTHSRRHRHPGGAASIGSLPAGPRSTRADAAQPGGESWLPLVAGGALVLLVAGGGGLGLRRRYLQT